VLPNNGKKLKTEECDLKDISKRRPLEEIQYGFMHHMSQSTISSINTINLCNTQTPKNRIQENKIAHFLLQSARDDRSTVHICQANCPDAAARNA